MMLYLNFIFQTSNKSQLLTILSIYALSSCFLSFIFQMLRIRGYPTQGQLWHLQLFLQPLPLLHLLLLLSHLLRCDHQWSLYQLQLARQHLHSQLHQQLRLLWKNLQQNQSQRLLPKLTFQMSHWTLIWIWTLMILTHQ